jgi:hypothetical protein
MLDKSIIKSLASYDGKHVLPFHTIAEDLAIRPDALERTTSIIESNEVNAHIGGTWILKHLIEIGLETDERIGENVLHWLKEFSEPNAQLHLLQILNRVSIPESKQSELFNLAQKYTSNKNTLIRAWAYNALCIVAHMDPTTHDETLKLLIRALKTESPSVRARIRNSKFFGSIK